MFLRLKLDADSSDGAAAEPSTSASTSLVSPLTTSPTSGSHIQGRRPSRTSSGRMKGPLPVQLSVEPINRGRFSSPTALLDLGGGYIFVGSHYGDSLLVRMNYTSTKQGAGSSTSKAKTMDVDEVSSDGASIDIVNTYTNLAPIVDFCVVETDAGQGPVSGSDRRNQASH